MLRKIAAVVLGILVAATIVAAVEAIGHTVYPVPGDLDINDTDRFKSYVASLPIGAFLFVLAAWTLATLGGGLLASFIARDNPFLYTTIVGSFVLVATVANLIMIPHPLWFSITAVISIAIMTYVAGTIASSLLSTNVD